MPTHKTLKALFGGIADAIREKTGESEQIVADNFPTAIQAIVTGIQTTIEVTTKARATVTATQGGTIVNGTADGSGHCSLAVKEAGTWTVSATLEGERALPVSVAVVSQYEANVPFVSTTLNDNDWLTISEVSSSGQGQNYFSVGDTKSIPLNGNLVGTIYSNKVVDAVIIGFDHNAEKEGNDLIHFQLGKIGSQQVALCDSHYPSRGSSEGFRMNPSDTNAGGWSNSYMRNIVLGNSGTPASPPDNSLMAIIPAELRNVLKSVTKWTDNTGNGSASSSNITSTTDFFSLPSEFEVMGSKTNANQYEQNHQTQYAFYKSGNAKLRYKDTATTTVVHWALRSPGASAANTFCQINDDGNARNTNVADASTGLAPIFYI